MRALILALAILLTPALRADTTSPTLHVAPTTIVSIGPRNVTAEESALSAQDISNAKRRYTEARFKEWEEKSSRQKMASTIVEASIAQYIQAKGIEVTDEEIGAWVKEVRAKGAENRNREITKIEAKVAALQAEIDKFPAQDETKLKVIKAQKDREEATLKNLKDAFKMDETMADFYPGMGRMYLQHWKSRKSLINEFGGNVYQIGKAVEPVDAIEALMKQQESEGLLVYKNEEARAAVQSWFDARPEMNKIEPEEGKKRLNTQNW